MDNGTSDPVGWRTTYPKRTVGWLARMEPLVSVVHEDSPGSGNVESVTHIPPGMVKRIEYLTNKRRKVASFE